MTTFYEYPDYLCHYGVKGMKWGVRRYQNADGTLTDAGKKRSSKAASEKTELVDRLKNSNKFNERKTYFDSLEFRNKTTDSALKNRINELRDWDYDNWNDIPNKAKEICRDVTMTRKPEERHKYFKELSRVLDASVYDDPGVMAVNKLTGQMRYNSCTKFDLKGVRMNEQSGLYNTRELDKVLGHEPDSTYYYTWGELHNTEK